jgi:adenylate cyclase
MRLGVKIFLLVFGLAFIVSGATGSYFYFSAKKSMFETIRQELMATAAAFAQTISGDELESLVDPKQMNSATYKEIQEVLWGITQTNDEFFYAYTMRFRDGQVYFVVDSPPSDDNGDGVIGEDELPAAINEPYSDPPQTLLEGFIHPSADHEPIRDKWGWFISGYAPVFDREGKAVGLLGIDMSVSQVQAKLERIKKAGLLSLFFALGIGLVLTIVVTRGITSPLKAMKEGFKQIARGNFDFKLKVKSNDELGQLSEHFNILMQELKEKQLLQTSLGKIVHKGVLRSLMKGSLKLGGEIVCATVLFCDLRGFTTMSEKLPPAILVSLLNEYFTVMVKIVEEYGGMVDKFVGDKLMAVFGSPTPLKNEQKCALDAALEMIKRCDELNRRLGLQNDFVLENSIGIHAGAVLAGNVGAPERMEFTIMGDCVNIASRLEKKTRALGTRLAISKDVAEKIEDLPQEMVFIGQTFLQGRKEALEVFVARI